MLLTIIILGIGCSPDEAQDDGVKEHSESIETTSMPSLYIHRHEKSSLHDTNFHAVLDRYCWKESIEDTCASPSNPKELLEGRAPLIVTPEEYVWFHYNNRNEGLPYPDKVTFTQFSGKEETGMEVEVLGEYAQDMQEIQTPNERGRYYYLVHMEWTGTEDLIGEAYYAFTILVRGESN